LTFIIDASLRHSLPALVFAMQSPYPGWQTVVYNRTLCEQNQRVLYIVCNVYAVFNFKIFVHY